MLKNYLKSTSVSQKIKQINLRENSVKSFDDHIAVEIPVHLCVNGHYLVTFLCLPTQLKELGIGWLFSQTLISSIDEITQVDVKNNHIQIQCKDHVNARIQKSGTMKIVDSSCGSTFEDFLFLKDAKMKPLVTSSYSVKADAILRLVRELTQRSTVFKLTGGTHSSAIFLKEDLVAFAEDIGRHNAVDKVIGTAAIKKIDFSNCVIISSGRQPANMVLKAARVGIPIVASIAGPISSGIEVATLTGVTLICFIRGNRMNIYTSHERIETS